MNVDYILLTKESKKIWKQKIVEALQELEEMKIEAIELNSRDIFIDLVDNDEKTLRERLSNLCINRAKPKSLPVAEAVALSRWNSDGWFLRKIR